MGRLEGWAGTRQSSWNVRRSEGRFMTWFRTGLEARSMGGGVLSRQGAAKK